MTSLHDKKYKALMKQLKQLRLDAGLTQTEVAEKLNKPQTYVSKYETSQRRLDILELKEILDIFDKKIDNFIQ